MSWPTPTIPDLYRTKGITAKQWTDWQWQLQNSIKNIEILRAMTGKNFPVTNNELRLTPFLFSLINWKNASDPIGLQHLPHRTENEQEGSLQEIWERENDFFDGENRLIQQKYPDVIALRISNTCQSFCRFCFEKERTLLKSVPTKTGESEWKKALTILASKKRVRQVLLTGGDPSILPDALLQKYLESLLAIPQLKTIRINTRTLLHNPYRITPEFAVLLGNLQKRSWEEATTQKGERTSIPRGKEIKIGLHFNHPNELTPEALTAIRRLQREGIQLYNQTVLLKNVNDRATILQKLFRQLREEGVELHYLSQAMAVPGTSHFRTKIRDGQKIMEQLRRSREFRGQLPAYEYSHFTGKEIIPLSMNKDFREVKGGVRFKSSSTKRWIEIPQ